MYTSNMFLMEIYWGPAGAPGRPGVPLRIEVKLYKLGEDAQPPSREQPAQSA